MGEQSTVRQGVYQLRRARENMIEAGRKAGMTYDQIRLALGDNVQAFNATIAEKGLGRRVDRAQEVREAFAVVGVEIGPGLLEAQTMMEVEKRFLDSLGERGLEFTHETIRAKTRKRAIVWPRMVAIWLQRTIRQQSFPRIAEFYRLEDHSTVMHACRVGKSKAIARDEDMREAARVTLLHFHKPSTADGD